MKSGNIISSAIISLMLMASCSEDIEISGNGGDPKVSFKVSMPRELGTRADGETTSHINTLEWSLFEVRAGGEKHLVYTEDRQLQDVQQIENVELSLVKGATYKVTFCAYDRENRSFASCDDGVVTVDYTAAGNNQTGDDIFVGCSNEILADNETHEVPVVLHRPFAQLNWASSDLEAASVTPYLNGTSASVTVKTGLYTTLDLFSGEVSGKVEGPVSFPTFECDDLNNGIFETSDETNDYKLLAMNYLLTGTESSIINCEMNFSGKVSLTTSVENASVAPNFRTNVYGSLISDPANLQIDMSRAFADNKAVLNHPYAEIVEKLINGEDVEIPEGATVDIYGFGTIYLHDKQTVTINGTLLVASNQIKLSGGKSATINGTGLIRSKNESVKWLVSIYSGSTLNLSGISMQNDGVSQGATVYIDSATANIDGVSITGNSHGINCYKNAILNISNSYINMSYHKSADNYYCGYPLHIQSGSNAVITDCEVDSDCGVFIKASRVEIEGGSITTRSVSSIGWNHCCYLYDGSDLVIKGGKFKSCTSWCIYNHGQELTPVAVSAVVEGGQFNNKITFTDNIRLAEGCEQVRAKDENGTYWYYVRPIE